jgi:hypothetical protein
MARKTVGKKNSLKNQKNESLKKISLKIQLLKALAGYALPCFGGCRRL